MTLYRAYDPNIGRWLNRDPIGYRGGINNYSYAFNNSVKFTDALGLDITITGHRVGGIGPWHTGIRITPDNQDFYINDPKFQNIDEFGKHYTELSAGPTDGGYLGKNINRDTDIGKQAYQSAPLPPPCGKNEDEIISDLFNHFYDYGNDLSYSLFPRGAVPMFEPNYNSNSFTSGLLESVGYPLYGLPIWAPGWTTPVPGSAFIK